MSPVWACVDFAIHNPIRMSNIRTFIGVFASQRINSNISRLVDRFAAVNKKQVNWVPEENLHLTLNFVGDIPDRDIPEFCRDAKGVISSFEPFDLTLGGLGAFPSLEGPRTIWVGAEQGGEAMAEMSQEITKFLRDWSLGKSRFEFEPHMTIGRVKKGAECPDELAQLLHRFRNHDAGSCHIDKAVICSSIFEGGRPQYAPMATIPLDGDDQ